MIVLSYNGFRNSQEIFAKEFSRTGIDKNRVLGHDSSAALVIDGKLIAAAEEERFTRVKKTAEFPSNSIAFCLHEAKISIEEVDLISFPWNFNDENTSNIISKIFQSNNKIEYKFKDYEKQKTLYEKVTCQNKIIHDFNELLKTEKFNKDNFLFVPHHISHLINGFYTSNFNESAFIISDGRSELYSSVMGFIDNEKINYLEESNIPLNDSIGMLYSKFTKYLGFMPNCDEYKVMGLASFGKKNKYAHLIDKFISFHKNGKYSIKVENPLVDDQDYYHFFEENFGNRESLINDFNKRANISKFIQTILEKAMNHQVKYLQSTVNSNNIIIDGGVALNCVNNYKLLENSKYLKSSTSFSANDSGISIGAAYYPFYLKNKDVKTSQITPYLGPEFSKEEIYFELGKTPNITTKHYSDEELYTQVSYLLRKKKVIGWFQGKMEFGPRALGNRSILADPTFSDMQDIINLKVKKREKFRPFAPIILEEEAANYFHLGKKKEAPFMTSVFPVIEEKKLIVPSVTHIDGTARVQTVNRTQNRRLWELLNKHNKLHGIPCLINTSFNVMSEPIVCTPKDAIKCFLETSIDFLVIGNFLVEKNNQNERDHKNE